MSLIICFLHLIILFSPCYAQVFGNSLLLFFQFGDSTSDVGNTAAYVQNSNGLALPPFNQAYGIDYPGLNSGRWSNGRLIVDYFATYEDKNYFLYAVPETVLSIGSAEPFAISFAYAGSTILNSSTLASYNISSAGIPTFGDQIIDFIHNCNQVMCSLYPNVPIFIGPFGATEIIYAYTQRKSFQNIMTLIPLIVNGIIQGIEELSIKQQPPYVVVALNFPLGCFPCIISYVDCRNPIVYDEYGCVEVVNNYTIHLNELLQSGIQNLSEGYSSIKFINVDYYKLLLNIIKNPSSYGFVNNTILQPCCGNGVFTLTSQFCGGTDAGLCSNRDEYIHWDGINLTQKVHKIAFEATLTAVKNATMG